MTPGGDAPKTRELLERLARVLDALEPERRAAFGAWLAEEAARVEKGACSGKEEANGKGEGRSAAAG